MGCTHNFLATAAEPRNQPVAKALCTANTMTQYNVGYEGAAGQASCTAPAHHIAGLQLAAAATVAAAARIASGPFEAVSDDLQRHILGFLLCATQADQLGLTVGVGSRNAGGTDTISCNDMTPWMSAAIRAPTGDCMSGSSSPAVEQTV